MGCRKLPLMKVVDRELADFLVAPGELIHLTAQRVVMSAIKAFAGYDAYRLALVLSEANLAALGPLPDNCLARPQPPPDLLERAAIVIAYAEADTIRIARHGDGIIVAILEASPTRLRDAVRELLRGRELGPDPLHQRAARGRPLRVGPVHQAVAVTDRR